MALLRLMILLSIFCICFLRPIYSQEFVIAPTTVILFPGEPSARFLCLVNPSLVTVSWEVNGRRYGLDEILDGDLPGHNVSGSNLTVSSPMNGTKYVCVIPATPPAVPIFSDPAFLYIAAAPDQVPGVMVITDSITLDDDDDVTLTLSWGEPFNNFDPLINYTVSCSSDETCPPDFTTTDNTTRSYTVTNLTAITNYTFSVVATNSIGSGEAGVLNITAPSLPDNVTGVMLMCRAIGQINRCTVQWESVTVGDGPLEQPLIYEVNYNGTMQNVTSPNTTLTFIAPSLPDEVFSGYITVTVTAINRLGRGMPSDPEDFLIMSSSVIDVQVVVTPEDANNSTYLFTFNCTIHPDSMADMCEVTVTSDDPTETDSRSGPVENYMATVTIDGLACGVTYSITAAGILNEELFGLVSSFGTAMGNCSETTPSVGLPTNATTSTTTPPITESPGGSTTDDDDNTGAIVGGVIGGICGAILVIILIILIVYCCMKREKSSRPTSPGDRAVFRPASGTGTGSGVKVQTLDRYGKPVPLEGDTTDTGVELTGYSAKSPEFTVTTSGPPSTFQGNEYQSVPSDEKNRTPSVFMPEGSYDTLAPADEPTAPSAQVVPPTQNGQSNPNAPRLNYADLEQFTRKPASVKKPDPQPASQYAVIDPKSLQQGTYT